MMRGQRRWCARSVRRRRWQHTRTRSTKLRKRTSVHEKKEAVGGDPSGALVCRRRLASGQAQVCARLLEAFHRLPRVHGMFIMRRANSAWWRGGETRWQRNGGLWMSWTVCRPRRPNTRSVQVEQSNNPKRGRGLVICVERSRTDQRSGMTTVDATGLPCSLTCGSRACRALPWPRRSWRPGAAESRGGSGSRSCPSRGAYQ